MPREKWLGVEEPELGEIFDGIDEKSGPLKFFERIVRPGSVYEYTLHSLCGRWGCG